MNGLSKDAARRVIVDEATAGQRIDNMLLRLLKGVPKSHVYRILRSGEVRVNSRRVDPTARLVAGDELRIPPLRLPAERTPILRSRTLPRLAVIYEDDALVALDKQSGLAVHGGSGVSYGLIEALRAQRPQARFLELAHRLDRETSGVLIVAKSRAALVALHAMLRDGAIDKRYLVLVRGKWRDAKRKVELPLLKFVAAEGERRVRVEPGAGKAAVTTFRRLKTWPDAEVPMSLLEAELETGRTHQIRVHLTYLGFPLAGDDKYGDFQWNRALARQGLKRMFLHAASLALPHPIDGRPLRLEAAPPDDLSTFLHRLDRPLGLPA